MIQITSNKGTIDAKCEGSRLEILVDLAHIVESVITRMANGHEADREKAQNTFLQSVLPMVMTVCASERAAGKVVLKEEQTKAGHVAYCPDIVVASTVPDIDKQDVIGILERAIEHMVREA